MSEEMKMVMITYNEAIDMEIMELVDRCGIKSYTKQTAVYGKGTASGTHMGDDVWPGRNNILYIACTAKQAREILSCINDIRKTLGKEGVKAFVLPIEELT